MSRFINPQPQFILAGGELASGATMAFYETGTNDFKTIFADVNETTPIDNPITLGARGEVPDVFYSGTARVVAIDAEGTQIFDLDSVGTGGATGAYSTWDSNAVYSQGDIIYGFDGLPYQSLVNENEGNDPTLNPNNNTNWTQLFQVTSYNAQVTYQPNEFVFYDGVIYRSVSPDNIGNDPSTDGAANWVSVADARYVVYNNTSSGLVAVTGQAAIDELKNLIDNQPSPAVYRGQLDVSSGDAALPPSPTNGDLYVIAVSGTITLSVAGAAPTATAVNVGQQIIYNDTAMQWDLIAQIQQAASVSYSNITSGLAASDVQSALDEIEGRVDNTESNTTQNANDINGLDNRLSSAEGTLSTNGDVVTKDVVSSNTDTTNDRVVTTGWLNQGLTGALPASSDLHSEDINGITVRITIATANRPFENGVAKIHVYDSNNRVIQAYATDQNLTARKRYLNGVWQAWEYGVVSYATTSELQSSRPNKTGQRAENRERANAQYTLAADGYTALPGDVTAANGRVWALQRDNIVKLSQMGAVTSSDCSAIITAMADDGTFTNVDLQGLTWLCDGMSADNTTDRENLNKLNFFNGKLQLTNAQPGETNVQTFAPYLDSELKLSQTKSPVIDWKGLNVLWLGTSIPHQGANVDGYPERLAEVLNFNVQNYAWSGSHASYDIDGDAFNSGTIRALSMTEADRLAGLATYGPTSAYDDSFDIVTIASKMTADYRIKAQFATAPIDVVVLDHNHNDRKNLADYTANVKTITGVTIGSTTVFGVDNVTGLNVGDGCYVRVTGIGDLDYAAGRITGIAGTDVTVAIESTGFSGAFSSGELHWVDRTTIKGAFDFLIAYTKNMFIQYGQADGKIILCGAPSYFTNDVDRDHSIWSSNRVIREIADTWGLAFFDVANALRLTYQDQLTYLPDSVHPSTPETREIFTNVWAKWMRGGAGNFYNPESVLQRNKTIANQHDQPALYSKYDSAYAPRGVTYEDDTPLIDDNFASGYGDWTASGTGMPSAVTAPWDAGEDAVEFSVLADNSAPYLQQSAAVGAYPVLEFDFYMPNVDVATGVTQQCTIASINSIGSGVGYAIGIVQTAGGSTSLRATYNSGGYGVAPVVPLPNGSVVIESATRYRIKLDVIDGYCQFSVDGVVIFSGAINNDLLGTANNVLIGPSFCNFGSAFDVYIGNVVAGAKTQKHVMTTAELQQTVQSYTLAELQAMSPTLTGQRVICTDRADAPLELAASGYTAQTGDIVAANGRVWKLERPQLVSQRGLGVSSLQQTGFNHVAFIGDSLSDEVFGPLTAFRNAFYSEFGYGGDYIAFFDGSAGYGKIGGFRAPTVTELSYSPDLRATADDNFNNTRFISLLDDSANYEYVRIYYLEQPLGCTFAVGHSNLGVGGAATTVDTSSATTQVNYVDMPKSDGGTGMITIRSVVDGKICVFGVELLNANQENTYGGRVTRMAIGGSEAAEHAALDATQYTQWLNWFNPDVVFINLGMNDRLVSSASQILADVQTINSRIPSTIKRVFVAPNASGDDLSSALPEYRDLLRAWAESNNYGFIDNTDVLGSYERAVEKDLMNDGVHPNDSGRTLVSGNYLNYIGLPAAAKATPPPEFEPVGGSGFNYTGDLTPIEGQSLAVNEPIVIYTLGLNRSFTDAIIEIEIYSKDESSSLLSKSRFALKNATTTANYVTEITPITVEDVYRYDQNPGVNNITHSVTAAIFNGLAEVTFVITTGNIGGEFYVSGRYISPKAVADGFGVIQN